jgi:hypothetical protein
MRKKDSTKRLASKPAYVCPPDAGPAWRAAYEAGCDMAQLEENLRLTPEERLDKHQRKLDEIFARRAQVKKKN